MDGRLQGDQAVFEPASGNRQYLAGNPNEFSATRQFPPPGHKPYTATACGEAINGKTDEGKSFALKKIIRKSPTQGAPPPAGAIVLFDGSSADEWNGGRCDGATHLLNTDSRDILSKRKSNNFVMHLEFLLPFRPEARGQGRGNSGYYLVDHYEVQILDSFGLDGVNNECGGVYSKADPKVNMCFPPLVWQTYDVEFTNAVRDADGNKVKNAVLTLRHNGVAIHENLEISGPTGGHRNEPEGTPGAVKLQGHGNPLQFRNIWVVEELSCRMRDADAGYELRVARYGSGYEIRDTSFSARRRSECGNKTSHTRTRRPHRPALARLASRNPHPDPNPHPVTRIPNPVTRIP